ncbi:protoporphyrinogen/coproporphyrinogen oxidase [Arthrobacter sp. UM1]|uniref:protoporphyrinogen/coproporphyrinogen oxidase n=1 Tax=Arthrobacter sp. UM1 TaxID=2766776 RepID=UPI001CF6AB09|nr:FAD-dependent oxidoreductase [Arthrobacter sp. UM1]MCB4207810.1 FAD-dependent oxidoreductase [Arthrobacter sp. UM1]
MSTEALRPGRPADPFGGEWDVVVLGGGVAGLIAARRAALRGESVLLLEASERFGGAVGLMPLAAPDGGRLEGLLLERGAESFATRSPAVPRLLEELGMADRVEAVSDAGSWIVGVEGEQLSAAPSPALSLLGIPGDLAAPDVRAFLGEVEAERAAERDARPAGTPARDMTLGALVRDRMGDAVLERLVAPVVTGVYSTHPDEIDAAVVHPGLIPELERRGSLAGAVAALRASSPAGAAVAGVRGGVGAIAVELEAQAREAGASLVTGARATGLARNGDGSLTVTAEVQGPEGRERRDVRARSLVLAVPAGAGQPLLESLAPGITEEAGSGTAEGGVVVLVTLCFAAGTASASALASGPRGNGVLVSPAARGIGSEGAPRSLAKALTHSTSKWPWLRAEAGGREAVRLSFNAADLAQIGAPEAGIGPGAVGAPSERLAERALADASALLGVELSAEDLEGTGLASHRNTAPFAQSGHRESFQESVARWTADPRLEGVALAGAWFAGTGLAAVVGRSLEDRP